MKVLIPGDALGRACDYQIFAIYNRMDPSLGFMLHISFWKDGRRIDIVCFSYAATGSATTHFCLL